MVARSVACGFMLLVFAGTAAADVRLSVRSDGRKVLHNLSGGSATGRTDLDWFAKQHNRRSRYDEIIERHAQRLSVDPVLVRAVIQVESNFVPTVVSHKGARGLMQLIPATASRFAVRDLFDPEQNIRGGVEYLAFLRSMFGDDLSRVLAAYNAGENAVTRHRGIPPYKETQEYVRRALTVYYGRPWGGVIKLGGSGTRQLKGGFMGNAAAAPVAPVRPHTKVAAYSGALIQSR